MKQKLTKKDLQETRWYLKIEESRTLQRLAFELGFVMTNCFVGLWDMMEDLCQKKIFNPDSNAYEIRKPPYDCHILYFESDTFSGCNLTDDDYEDYKEMKFEDFPEFKERLKENSILEMKEAILEGLKW